MSTSWYQYVVIQEVDQNIYCILCKVKKGFLEAKEETRKQLGEFKTLHLDKAKEKFINWAHPSLPARSANSRLHR